MMKNEFVRKECLPTPFEDFTSALRVVRNFLVQEHFQEVFANRPRKLGAPQTLRDAFDVIDCYLERLRLEEEDSDFDD
ncbi:MAG: hypothetical protein R3C59_00265 [Planctomycetaceae bacterium]